MEIQFYFLTYLTYLTLLTYLITLLTYLTYLTYLTCLTYLILKVLPFQSQLMEIQSWKMGKRRVHHLLLLPLENSHHQNALKIERIKLKGLG